MSQALSCSLNCLQEFVFLKDISSKFHTFSAATQKLTNDNTILPVEKRHSSDVHKVHE